MIENIYISQTILAFYMMYDLNGILCFLSLVKFFISTFHNSQWLITAISTTDTDCHTNIRVVLQTYFSHLFKNSIETYR